MGAEIDVIDADNEIVADHAHLVAVDEADHTLMQVWLDGEGYDTATLDDALAGDVTDVVGLALLVDGVVWRIEAFACGAIGGIEPLELLGKVAEEGPGDGGEMRGVHCCVFYSVQQPNSSLASTIPMEFRAVGQS